VSRPRVVIADDHALLLDAFRSLLQADCDVVGCVTDGHALLEAASALQPDIVLLDIAMPRLNGLDAALQLRQAHSGIKVVFLTVNEDPDAAAAALRAGAAGFLLKRSAGSELRTAIAEVARGGTYVTPLIQDGALENFGSPERESDRGLTLRQREVVQLIAEGRSLKEVAAALNITPRTAAFHKYRIMSVLNVRSTAELVQYAVRHHMV
jgi:DNA-binding NarL/FixJ family response regulator